MRPITQLKLPTRAAATGIGQNRLTKNCCGLQATPGRVIFNPPLATNPALNISVSLSSSNKYLHLMDWLAEKILLFLYWNHHGIAHLHSACLHYLGLQHCRPVNNRSHPPGSRPANHFGLPQHLETAVTRQIEAAEVSDRLNLHCLEYCKSGHAITGNLDQVPIGITKVDRVHRPQRTGASHWTFFQPHIARVQMDYPVTQPDFRHKT